MSYIKMGSVKLLLGLIVLWDLGVSRAAAVSNEEKNLCNNSQDLTKFHQLRGRVSAQEPFSILITTSPIQVRQSEPTHVIHFGGDKHCPRRVLFGEGAIALRSTCPFYYVINMDPDRYPRELLETRCKCSHCINSRKHGMLTCQPMFYYVPVLRRVGYRTRCGARIYRREKEAVQVGCTCAGHPGRHAQRNARADDHLS